MRAALTKHDATMRRAIEGVGGTVVKHTGDGVMGVFADVPAAVDAALAAQRNVEGLVVRIGLHAGTAEPQHDGDYTGLTPSRAARVMAAAHGGQILLSATSAALAADHLPVGVTLRDLGEHRLRGLSRPERLWQVQHPTLRSELPPPLGVGVAGNLPLPATVIVGRGREHDELVALVARERLVTLTGAGGCGKTTLALEIAHASVGVNVDGAWWVDLAPVAVGAHVLDRVASSIG